MNRKIQTVLIFSFWITGLHLYAFTFEVPTDTLPVVVHVIHTGTPIGASDNPPDNLIVALLNQMNDAFQKNGPNYGGADIDLAFQLARKSPVCTTTTGIIRIDGSAVPDYSSGGITTDTIVFPNSAHELQVKALSRWPNTDYLNIWIVNTIDGNPNFPGGYAFFPQYNSALNDGIVLRSSVVNGTNKTIIHELGHYFFLYHTFGNAWGSCQTETNCLTDGDIICDTENCNYQFDCSADINPCTNEAWIITDMEHQYTVLNNYMGYTDCQWMFTEGQKARMLFALNTFRPGLLSSCGLDTIIPSDMPMACAPVAQNGLSPYYGIERVKIGPLEVYSNTSAADGNFYLDRTCNQSLHVAAGDSIPIQITCSYQNYSQVSVYLDINNDGDFELPDELMTTGDGGLIADTLVIPLTGIELCVPHRLRIVVEHPAAPAPTPCMLVGTQADGVGQIEDYALIIQPRQVESVNSGDWDDPESWSCNCIPSSTDFVYVMAGDFISITPQMGTIECADIHLEPGANLDIDGDLVVAGGCH